MICHCKPPRWSDLTPLEQSKFGNGCGPVFLPDWLIALLFGWFFEAKCRRHDFGYGRGGSEADRKKADLGFYRAMQRDAAGYADNSTTKEVALKALAFLFYVLVRCFGWLRFNYGPYRTITELMAEAN